MILHQYLVIHASFVFYVIIKILCKIFEKRRSLMHDKTLASIPENSEIEQEIVKWVPKKKHEILKAKYKCLKKLFQIYDASVIGILPETVIQEPLPVEKSHRRKRSYRTKTDACAGTSEFSSGDVTQSENETKIATTVINELKLQVSAHDLEKTKAKTKDDKYTQDSKENISINENKIEIQQPYVQPFMVNQRRKPTRFQMFIQRLLGIHRESLNHVHSNTKVYAASDNNISNKYEHRRRRGLRFRRLKHLKKIHSEIVLRDTPSPVILSYVQTVQRNCLLDTTPRQCPILGCKMIFYGIINYNDHLNLCHFTDKKFVCHYCHEGFNKEHDKMIHENEHIGIIKLGVNSLVPADTREIVKTTHTNDTQTETDIPKNDLPEEKIKKIVSFFEKIQDHRDQVISEIKKKRFSESNIHKTKDTSTDETPESDTSRNSNQSTSSCIHLKQKIRDNLSSSGSETHGHLRCQMCGKNFDFRRQLSLHVDLKHKVPDKFPKYHSCAGIINRYQESEEPARSQTESFSMDSEYSKNKCDLRCEPSTNIVYYTSTETIGKKPSSVNRLVQKVRTGFCYEWKPGTKIIRV